MIRSGVILVASALALAGCTPVGSLEIDAQRVPQVAADKLTEAQLAGFSERIAPESVRLLGTEDGLDYYVGSTDSLICLIAITDDGPAGACGSGLPVKVALNGVFNAELWATDDAAHDLSGHWLGDHLWLAESP